MLSTQCVTEAALASLCLSGYDAGAPWSKGQQHGCCARERRCESSLGKRLIFAVGLLLIGAERVKRAKARVGWNDRHCYL